MLSEEQIKKRLKALNSSQESVQMTSMWVLHHKDALDRIAQCWMELYRNGNEELSVALIYLMNHVVQTGSKKDRGDTLIQAFHPHVVNAFALAKSTAVRKAICRCLEIFDQRSTFPPHILDEMKVALHGKQSSSGSNEQQPSSEPSWQSSELDATRLIQEIESMLKQEQYTEKAKETLERSDLALQSTMHERMKDKAEGKRLMAEMVNSKMKLEELLRKTEKHQSKCTGLMGIMKQAMGALKLQLNDVVIVDDAYQSFNTGIRDTTQELDEIIERGVWPSATPPRDAPSPSAEDDPFDFGQGEVKELGGEDMEMEEDEEEVPQPSAPQIKPGKPFTGDVAAPLPSTSSHFTTTSGSGLDPRLQRLMFGRQNPPAANKSLRGGMDPRYQQRPTSIPPPATLSVPPLAAIRSGNGVVFDPTTPPPSLHRFDATGGKMSIVAPEQGYPPHHPLGQLTVKADNTSSPQTRLMTPTSLSPIAAGFHHTPPPPPPRLISPPNAPFAPMHFAEPTQQKPLGSWRDPAEFQVSNPHKRALPEEKLTSESWHSTALASAPPRGRRGGRGGQSIRRGHPHPSAVSSMSRFT